jgi:hypothetical protein
MFEDPEPLSLVQPGALGVWNNSQAGQFRKILLIFISESKLADIQST